jgi:hypothetical protein
MLTRIRETGRLVAKLLPEKDESTIERKEPWP